MSNEFSGLHKDLRKVAKNAIEQGWRVEKKKEYWYFYPEDKDVSPSRVAGTPSSQRTIPNYLADLKRKGYRP